MAQIRRNPPLDRPLAAALVEVWAAVSNAGGAVGFVPPVHPDDVWPVAETAFARVRAGADDLVVAYDGDAPVGFGFLATNDWLLYGHWASVKRLQRHPDRGGRGVGTAMLAELEDAALDRGLDRLVLTVRGGTGLEGFYLAHGFRLDARLPGRIRVREGDDREELVMSKALRAAAAQADTGATLRVRRLDPDLPLPGYAHPGDAGLDLRARAAVSLAPGERAVVPTGVAVAVPAGCVGLVHPRSGLAARAGVALVNAPGTIDAGYRGEVQVILVNLDRHEPVALARGERIAQLVVQRVETVTVTEVAELPPSARGARGFGSTGP
ncbi:MAG TPA: dUTP diphosphatase [Egibacteraceae bacterium]|nr:dUTP diphosphatase [Egibacteraceae bacterium]